ncbi:MAG: PAS domain S-box protein [Verrucomicrobiales bacterium]|nr:PAS domain S-box protein [Verrucomicrobiales bacterium]
MLIIHSFGNAAPPFTTHSIAFETELTEKLGASVDLDEISLDEARYESPDMKEALVDYIRKRQARWQPDLVVPIGSPAGVFVAQYRDRLFPETSVLYAGMDQRRLPAGALQKNATLVGEDFNLPGFVEDILQVAPATTNIAVVIGASPVEQYWTAAIRKAFEPFTNRVSFTWLNDLPFDQMLERVSKLPPRSFIFLILLHQDAAGVTLNADEALKRIHAVANAPVNGIFIEQLGLGIVGGRLYQAAQEGVESAHIAIRILHGEPASSIPPKIVGPLPPQYDKRELQRWGISEANLPAGSFIKFRQPTIWQQYRWHIVGALVFCGLQTMLIIGLVANKLARKRVARDLRESEERMTLAAEAAEFGVWVWNVTSNQIWGTETWRRLFGFTSDANIGFEQLFQKIHPEDREAMEQEIKGAAEGKMDHLREYRIILPDGTQRWIASRGRMQTDSIGKSFRMFGVAVEITGRKRDEEKMRQLSLAVEQSPVSVVITDLQGKITYVNRKFSEVSGYSSAESLGQNPRFLKSGELPPSTYKELWDCITSGCTWSGDLHNRKKNGELHWERAVISPVRDAGGKITHFVAVKEDITERKQTNAAMHDLSRRLIRAHEMERARLGRELHDDVTQRLAILAIDAGRVERGADKVLAAETMWGIREGLVRLSEDIHALSYRLHPVLLEDLGLAEALKAECERFSRQESVTADVTLRDLPDVVPPETALCLFRVTQEALRNVARHARARRVEISVLFLNGDLQLVVHDDGIGFDPALQRARPSLGLASMRERVFLVDGEIEIESTPGQGTTILVTVPLKKAEG